MSSGQPTDGGAPARGGDNMNAQANSVNGGERKSTAPGWSLSVEGH